MAVSPQDVQDVIDVSGILANNGVDVKPHLVAGLLDWKHDGGNDVPTPAPVSAPAPESKAKAATKSGAVTPDPSVDDPGF